MTAPRPLDFGLMFFAASEDALSSTRYDLVLESARFADAHGLSSVWVPERHFTEFGCLYPNPAVLHAALARETRRVRLRAGSVVVPIHDPLRIAEEWAMVDNLSGGRIDMAVAPGWNPNDFAFFPERYADRRERLFEGLETLRRLWRGERLDVRNGLGQPVQVRVYPPPVQKDLAVWLTAAGSPDTFVRAGELGLNVLTHLLDHDEEDIAERIALYREARRAAGHDPDAGQVTLMLHTFLAGDLDDAREKARGPFTGWLASNAGLLKGLAVNRGEAFDPATLSPEDAANFADFLFERFFSSRSLMGTPQSCLPLVQRLHAMGVTEIACLLDFGPHAELILPHLPFIEQLMRLHAAQGAQDAVDKQELTVRARALLEARRAPVSQPESLAEVRARCAAELPVAEFYADMGRFGVQFGPRFRGIERLWRHDGEALARVRLADGLAAAPHGAGFEAHPAFLDACLQVFGAALPAGLAANSAGSLYLPTGLGEFTRHATLPACVFSHARLRTPPVLDAPSFEGDVRLFDEQGALVAEIRGFRLQRTNLDAGSEEPEASEGWHYERTWVTLDPPAANAGAVSGTWLVLADASGAGAALAQALEAGGARAQVVTAGTARAGGPAWTVDPARADDMSWLLDEALQGGACAGILHVWSLDAQAAETPQALRRAEELTVGGALHLTAALAARGLSAPVWLVTRGAQRVVADDVPSPAQALTWGFGTTLATEHPELWGGLIDLDPDEDAASCAAQVTAWLAARGTEPRVALRAGQAYGARLVRHAPSSAARPEPSFGAGTHLVSGGLGGLGLTTARWLVARGARHVALAGRTPLPPREAWERLDADGETARRVRAVRELEAAGARVHVAALDVSETGHVETLRDELRAAGFPPVCGVMHAAGVGRADKIVETTLAGAREVLAPKVAGTWNLERVFGAQLDYFVTFSSATHQLGVLGQGVAAYSAANAFMDALAHARRARQRPALSVCFGPWAGVGMAAQSGNDQRLLGFGVRGVQPEEGVAAIGRFMGTDLAEAWAIHVDWPALVRADAALASDPLVAGVARAAGAAVESDEERARREALLAGLRRATPRERVKLLATHIQDLTVAIMRLDGREAVDWRRGLFELGLDSLMALELKNRLQTSLGVPISSTLAFNFPTVDAIAAHLTEKLFAAEAGGAADARAEDAAVEARLAAASADIAGLDEAALESLLERKLETL